MNEEKSVLDIDKHRLHVEWERQPKLYHEYAEKLAQARAEVDRTKGRLELISAKVAMDARENPAAFGLKKVTDDAVKAATLMDSRYQKALADHNLAKAEVGHLQAMVESLDHRKVTLENLTRLRIADYFADPRIPKDARDREDEAVLSRTAPPVKREKR